MAEARSRSGSVPGNSRRQPSRLQRRAPASLQISHPSASQWNVAIPFLSPLAPSPTSPDPRGGEQGVKSREEARAAEGTNEKRKGTTAVVFKKWQHPAAPFCFEPPPMKPSFLPVLE
ncbi:hypothetical protein MLD38_027278 [Melastoma candidum]|uniref:Uncharacterized protein n=1 Tax=Melastoma candidum TaxID=119954 RepID=A0ACB9P184_9MYRT|nr:hypothetical protein MLD38_027278 [Melastoma candidum]